MTVTVARWSDRCSWNEFVASTPRAHFQQSWEWGALAPHLGVDVCRLGALLDGRLVGAMQVFIHPFSRTGRTYLYVPRGPAISDPRVSTLAPLLEEARRLGSTRRAFGIRMEPNVPDSEPGWKSTLSSLDFKPTYPPTQPRSSWTLDISPDCDTLLAAMKQKTRYNIRLAGRKGVEVRDELDLPIDEFYRLYQETAARDDFFIHPKDYYLHLFNTLRQAGSFGLLTARYQGKLLALITLVQFGPTCWYLQGASGNEHRNLMPTYLLQWEGIHWAREKGCVLYDFRAVPDRLREDQDMYGVYRFKEGFGGSQFTTMHTQTAAYQPAIFGLWQLFYTGRFALEQRRRARQGLPQRQFA